MKVLRTGGLAFIALLYGVAPADPLFDFGELPNFVQEGAIGNFRIVEDTLVGTTYVLDGNADAADGEGVLFIVTETPESGESSLSISMRIRLDEPKLATLTRRTNGTEETGYMLYILDSGYIGFRLADEDRSGTIRSSRSISPADGWVDISIMWDGRIAEGLNAVLDVGGTLDRTRIPVERIPTIDGDLSIGGLQRSRDGGAPSGQYFAGAIADFDLATLPEGSLQAELQTRSEFIRLPPIFSDGMVLQRDMSVPVWGWADPGTRVTVDIAGQSHTATSDPTGRWEVMLQPVPAGVDHELSVSSGVTITRRNVAFGEVWMCSGQSNMEWTMRNTDEYDEELAIVLEQSPPIRQFKFDRILRAHPDPAGSSAGGWVPLDPAQLSHFTAVGYHFARAIHDETGVPVGIINSTWGGTQIAPWIPMPALESDVRLKGYADWIHGSHENNRLGKAYAVAEMREWLARAETVVSHGGIAPTPPRWPSHPIHENHQTPTGIYNAMVAPIAGYGLRGFLWYQGESNRHDRDFYAVLMESLITGWREAWGDDNLPFYFVQLAPFRYGDNPGSLPHVQDAQRRVALKVPHASMAVISDFTNLDDIHPRRKREVGRRLAAFALRNEYGIEDAQADGPIVRDASFENDALRIRFDAPGGLTTRDGQAPDHFEFLDSHGRVFAAQARIDGGDVLLTLPEECPQPVAVRFAWSDTAIPNLISGVGLPTSPFRLHPGEGAIYE